MSLENEIAGAPAEDGDEAWRTARDRILGYLDALGVPAVRSVDLSARVLGETREEAGDDCAPVASSMRVLFRMLEDEGLFPIGAAESRPGAPASAVPPLNPGKMVSERPGFSAATRFFGKRRKTRPTRKISGLLMALLFLVFFIIL